MSARASGESSSPRSYDCTHPGCGKRYSRADHLARHKLNHDAPRIYRCESCNRSFVRQDLLDRHRSRHEQWAHASRSRDVARSNGESFAQKSRRIESQVDHSQEIASFGESIDPENSTRWRSPRASAGGRPSSRAQQLDSHLPSAGSEPIQMLLDCAGHQGAVPRPFSQANLGETTTDWSCTDPIALDSTSPGSAVPFASNELFASLFLPNDYSGGARYDWLFDGLDPSTSHPGDRRDEEPVNAHESTARYTPGFGRCLQQDPQDADLQSLLAAVDPLVSSAKGRQAFDVDSVAHQRLVSLFPSMQDLPTHSLFSAPALRSYLYLFFDKFNLANPLVHQPTFNATRADPSLLAAMVMIGAFYAPPQSCHILASRIGHKMWGALISLDDFRPSCATLPMLQALVLTEVFNSRMCSRQQHEMAHLFHNWIVTLARRNGVFTLPASPTRGSRDSQDSWLLWAKAEERKRITLFLFILDAQHASLFRHVPALGAFQLQLEMPCPPAEWSADTAQAWSSVRVHPSTPPRFLSSLKACMSPGSRLQHLDSFSRLLLLHGLMSVAYDLRWRQHQSSLLSSSGDATRGRRPGDDQHPNWREKLWRAMRGFMPSSGQCTSFTGICAVAQIALFSDILDLQVFAGLPSVCGQIIDAQTYQASKRSVKKWARSVDAGSAVVIAANFLLRHFQRPQSAQQRIQETLQVSLYLRWCLYVSGPKKQQCKCGSLTDLNARHHQLSALVIWAHSTALLPPEPSAAPASDFAAYGTSAHPDLDPALPLQGPYLSPPGPADATREQIAGFQHSRAETSLRRLSAMSAESIAKDGNAHYTRPILERVLEDLDCGSRWELIREGANLIRKLLKEHPPEERYCRQLPASLESSPCSLLSEDDSGE